MATKVASIFNKTTMFDRQVSWLHRLVEDGQLLADLAFADILVWAPTGRKTFVAVSHFRPSSAATLFYRDVVETEIRKEWFDIVAEAFNTGEIVYSKVPDSYEEVATRVQAVPVRMGQETDVESFGEDVIAVMTSHTSPGQSRIPSRQELTFNRCASDLFVMISQGSFPDPDSPSVPAQGNPRASDGLIRLDDQGKVAFASPNALSAFRRMGFPGELEDTFLTVVTTEILQGTLIVDESLPLVVSGRAPWRTDIQAAGVTVTLRAIPLRLGGQGVGAIILTRDVTQVRLREQQAITKDATIREINHRVKNNLQTVASLLRIQARRTQNEDTKGALNQAMRRVASIAIVHDTLSEGLTQNVDFDTVFERVLRLVVEVASDSQDVVNPRLMGSFGILQSQYATPLALVLTELVTNAVEHGIRNERSGDVLISTTRTEDMLRILVRDNGRGLPEGKLAEGLGTQIVRTIVQNELGGSIAWRSLNGRGTEVEISVPTLPLS